MTVNASTLLVSIHAGERYAQRVWGVADPSLKLVNLARYYVTRELHKATPVPNIAPEQPVAQEALMLKRCVALVKQGHVVTVLTLGDYFDRARRHGVEVESWAGASA